MEPNPDTSTSQPNIVINPPSTPKKNNYWLIIIVILLLAIFGVAVFIAWQIWTDKKQVNNQVQQVSQTEKQSNNITKTNPTIEQKKIAYIIMNGKNPTLWEINSDGTNKTVVIGGIYGSYISSFAWKNETNLSYAFCDKTCIIYTFFNGTITEEANPGESGGNTQILSLTWNHAGDQLAYIYKLPDGQMRMDFKSGAVKNVVKTFASLTAGQGGRGGSLDDSVSIYFSPDDKYVLVTNTLGQPTVNDKSTIWVFDSSGKEVLDIKSDTNTWATQATWPNNTILFKQGTELYQRDIFAPNSVKIGSISNFYNPISIAGIEKVFYWGTTNSLPYIGLYTGLDHKSTKFLEGYYKPNILDDARVVAIKAQKAPEGKEAMFPYVSGGISKIDLRDKKVTDLDSGDINMFAVSP